MKFLHTFLIALMMLGFAYLPVKADEDLFTVKDTESGFEETFETYSRAIDYYEDHLEEYSNLLLYENDRLISMEYGIVEFDTDEACSLEVDYYSLSKDEDDLLNGCYGIDAAYLYTDHSRNRVYFIVSGDRGYTSLDNVTLHPYETIDKRISVYHNDEHFCHNVMSQLDYDFYSYSIELDDGLDFLKEGDYFSYDGHYFYDDFKAMIDDYRNDTYENSINEAPYFNYYQYLPHRSLSNYTSEELNRYFSDTLAIDGRLLHYDDLNSDNAADEVNRSQIYGNIEDFFMAESIYGTNAMMLLSSAMYESSYGRSSSAFSENNLYLAAAYLGNDENTFGRYDSVADSIYAHSRYFISARYSNHRRSDYTGTHYGNKISGINVNYSPDQYFGEKSASMYYQLDSALGYKDRDSRAIGIIRDDKSVTFYHDEDLESRWFSISDICELSFVILDEHEDCYRVSIDNSFDDEYEYDFSRSFAYVDKEEITLILNEDKIRDYDLSFRHYDLDGGSILSKKQIDLREGADPKPYKEHYEFTGVSQEGVMQYKYIEAIDLIRPFNMTVELGGDIDLSNGVLRVFYEDSTYRDVEINSDMISRFDNKSEGSKEMTITYNGVSIVTPIEVSSRIKEFRNSIAKAIENKDYQFIEANVSRIRYHFSFDEIRQIDKALMEKNKRNYFIEDKTGRYDISFSGLELGLSDQNSFKYFGDTYYAIVRYIPYFERSALQKHSLGYGFEVVDAHSLSFRFNFENIELSSPVIVQVDIPDKKDDLIYSVYHLARNGDIVKMRTTQSDNYIQYMATESGSYMILSRKSANRYHIADSIENLSYGNMGVDNHRNNYRLFLIGVIALIGIIGVVFYYVLYNRNERLWKEFRRSLRNQDFVQEEKPKS